MKTTGTSLAVGQEIEVEVTDLSSEGEGVGRFERAVVFVDGAVPGDRVLSRVKRARKNRIEARVTRLLQSSPARIEPVCAHQAECGGCPVMVLEPEAALAARGSHLAQTLRRIGGIGRGVDRTVASPAAVGYRNRVAFSVTEVSGGALQLAFHGRRDPAERVPIRRCHLVPEGVTEAAQELLEALPRDGEVTPLRIEMRGSLARGEWMAVVHAPEGRWPGFAAAGRAWVDAAPWRAGLVRAVTDSAGRVRRHTAVAGKDVVTERIGGLDVELSAGSFLQVNPGVAERLYDVVGEMLRAGGTPRRVLDLYCGAGLIGALAVPQAEELVGVERHGPTLARARRLPGAGDRREWLRDDAEHAARALADAGRSFDAVTINPPRAGVGGGLPAEVARLAPQRVVLISCHPAALARDLARFNDHGFRVVEVVALDMFPQTPHLEAVVRLDATGGE